MRIAYVAHSLRSCWNHGNAHFLRGVLTALHRRGHAVAVFEERDPWSLQNLVRDGGDPDAWRGAYPDLLPTLHDGNPEIVDADVVIVHEWNDPALVAALGRRRAAGARFTLLFHDTHHRAASDPEAIRRFDLSAYDGVLAFGESLSEIYRGWGWGDRVFTWHEAADTTLFHPPAQEQPRDGAVWIGNWGDGERTAELETFLLRPTAAEGVALTIHGVRYPPEALAMLDRFGVAYRGWLPNHRAPEVFARHRFTLHVPRRFYVEALPGIPTIRVFEALACGIPLLSAPWPDTEGLFRPGADYLVAADETEMRAHIRAVTEDAGLRQALVANGLAAIRARHSCDHRAEELLALVARIRRPVLTES